MVSFRLARSNRSSALIISKVTSRRVSRYASFSHFEILKAESILIFDLIASIKQRTTGHGVLALFQREKKKKRGKQMVNRDGQQRCCWRSGWQFPRGRWCAIGGAKFEPRLWLAVYAAKLSHRSAFGKLARCRISETLSRRVSPDGFPLLFLLSPLSLPFVEGIIDLQKIHVYFTWLD